MTPDPILQVLHGYRLAGALKAAAELDLFTAMAGGATALAIAGRAGASVRGVSILLDALQGTGLVRKSGRLYRPSPLARTFLTRGSPKSILRVMPLFAHRAIWDSFADVASAVRKGRSTLPSNAHAKDQKFWEDFADATADEARRCAAEMVRIVRPRGPMRVLDVACGSGMYGKSVADANPRAEVTYFDQPNVLRRTRRLVGRGRFLAGDLFRTDLGGPYDLVIASHILHHFSLAKSAGIVKKIARALRPGGTLVAQEFLADDARRKRTQQLLFSLVMLVWTEGGHAYSFGEMRRLLTANGFRDVRFHLPDAPGQFVTARSCTRE
jgi:ubiquinone/menaquinone biosynthesis C-methylase UbiE